MKLGFVSAILHDLDLREVLTLARDEQYDVVELMCWPRTGPQRKYGGVTHLDVTEFTQAAADDTLGLCEELGVGISGLGYYPNPLSHDDEEASAAQAHLYKLIDAAPLLGGLPVNTFIGANHRLDLEANFLRFLEAWPPIVAYAAERRVRIAIENCPMQFADTWPFGSNLAQSPAIWQRMFEAIPSDNFGLNIDPSHLVMQLMDPIAPIAEFSDRIFHAHAKDMRIEHDRLDRHGVLTGPEIAHWGTPKIPGYGDLAWNRWVSALTDIHYDGAVCVEVEDEAFTDTFEGRRRSLQISRDVLRPLIGEAT